MTLTRQAVRLMYAADGIEPQDYGGRMIRVCGWLREFDGPCIEATHPEPIEILAPGS